MQEKIKTFKIIHLALCAGLIIAYIIIGEITSLEALKFPVIDNDSFIFLAFPLIAFLASNGLFKSQLKKANPKANIEENFLVYQTASIMRWAILEGAAFLLLILKKEFILFGILIIVYLLLLHPTEDRIKRDLEKQSF